MPRYRIFSSEDVVLVETEIFDYISTHLYLQDSDPIFGGMTLANYVIMMYHHTKYGYKKFNGSEAIIWTNIN